MLILDVSWRDWTDQLIRFMVRAGDPAVGESTLGLCVRPSSSREHHDNPAPPSIGSCLDAPLKPQVLHLLGLLEPPRKVWAESMVVWSFPRRTQFSDSTILALDGWLCISTQEHCRHRKLVRELLTVRLHVIFPISKTWLAQNQKHAWNRKYMIFRATRTGKLSS